MSMEKNKRQNHKIERERKKKKKIQPWMEFPLINFDIVMLQNWLRFP